MTRKLDQKGYGLIGTLINLVFGVILTLVALRFVFMLLGANAANGFVGWIYDTSQVFVAPFTGMFQNSTLLDGRIEMATVVAIVIYTVIAGILGRVFGGTYHAHPV